MPSPVSFHLYIKQGKDIMKAIIVAVKNFLFTMLSEFGFYSRSVQVGLTTPGRRSEVDRNTCFTTEAERHGIYHVKTMDGPIVPLFFTVDNAKHLKEHSVAIIQSIIEQGFRLGLDIQFVEIYTETERRSYSVNSFTPLSVLPA